MQQGAGFFGHLLAAVGHHRLNRCARYHLAHGTFCSNAQRGFRIVHLEQKLPGILDAPEHCAIGLDDVFVASQHLFFARVAGVGGRTVKQIGQFQLLDLGDLGQQHGFNRPWQVIMQPGLGSIHPAPQAQHHALLVRLHLVNAGHDPAGGQQAAQQQQALAAHAHYIQIVIQPLRPAMLAPGTVRYRGRSVLSGFVLLHSLASLTIGRRSPSLARQATWVPAPALHPSLSTTQQGYYG